MAPRRPRPAARVLAGVCAGAASLALSGCMTGAEAESAAATSTAPTQEPTLSIESDGGAPLQVLQLPQGFEPEGIAADEQTAYVGSLKNGRIVAIDLADGTRSTAVKGDGTPSLGMALDDDGRLWVAGGDDGDLAVFDPASGELLTRYQLGGRGVSFINDVVVGEDAAYVTDSQQPRIFTVPLEDGELPDRGAVQDVALTGEWEQGGGFGANGIETTRDGAAVLVVNTTTGTLYRVPTTAQGGEEPGAATAVDLDGADLTNGDGMVRDGRYLYVVRNRSNSVVELRLDEGDASGVWIQEFDSPEFDVPTTIALVDSTFLLPNARFGTPDPRNAGYQVVLIPQP